MVDLNGTGGTISGIDMGADGSVQFDFIPDFDGALVMQVTDPAGWMPSFEVYDDDHTDPQYVDNDGTLGAVWTTGDPLHIEMFPGDTEPDPYATVEVTWSYAKRASSRLEVALETDVVDETPASLYATISAGFGRDTISLSLIGPTTADDMQTEVLNDFGYIEDLAIPLPGLAAGDYFLRVEGVASGNEDVPFTVTGNPLSFLGSHPKALPVAPARASQVRWRLYGLHDQKAAYEFVHNPRSWSNLLPPNNFTHEKTTAPDGQILSWQAGDQPWRMEFTGYLDTPAEYGALTFWAGLHRRFWLVDHRNRAWLVTFEQFDASARIVPNKPWAHDYTMKAVVFMQG